MKKGIILVILMLVFACAAVAGKESPYIIGHITTCTGLMDNNYPADSTNWFYRKQHAVVQYFAYFLFPVSDVAGGIRARNKYFLFINPYELYSGSSGAAEGDNDKYTFENRWISPAGKIICEKILSWSKSDIKNKRIAVGDKQYIPYPFGNFIGINQTFPENGQEGMPEEKGLYHIEIYVNGELAAITFFEMKD
jgi:hypothetical protein